MVDDQQNNLTGSPQIPTLLAEQFQYTIEMSQEAVFWLGRTGQFTYVNEKSCRALGYTREELLSLFLWDIDPDFPPERWAKQWENLKKVESITIETRHRRKDGHIFPVEVSACQIDFGGNLFHAAFVRDISERITLETQLRQAQNMDSVGRLAGGIAHDFNNFLGLILGRSEMALRKLEPTDSSYKAFQEIKNVSRQAANLTQQLLAFARQQTIAPKILDLNTSIPAILRMLYSLVGENVRLNWLPGDQLWPIKIDPTQLNQILTNLSINSRDAITDVGNVTLETANVTLDKAYCRKHAGFTPGDFVVLSLSDDGCGMDKATVGKIFDPFFTMKSTGTGTGLGLAMVYGIVKQNQGFINVYSEPEQGTTFRIYFPRHSGAAEETPIELKKEPKSEQNYTILLVEDDVSLLTLGEEILTELGYKVLASSSPHEAIQRAKNHSGKIDLLLTDVVMPGMNGKNLANQLKPHLPDLKILFTSGYTANVIAHHGILDEGIDFLQKPLSINDLSDKLKEIFGR